MKYEILKGNFHTHYIEKIGDVLPMVEKYYEMGFDVLAITEHNEYTTWKRETDFLDKYGPLYKDRMVLIPGMEVAYDTCLERQMLKKPVTGWGGGDILFYFINEHPGGYVENGPHVDIKDVLSYAKKQKAITVVAHDVRPGREVIYPFSKMLPIWNFREKFPADGYEIFNPSPIDNIRAPIKEVAAEGYLVLGNSDAHSLESAENAKHIYTLVFAKERTSESVRDAFENRRTVAVAGELYAGHEEWVRKAKEKGYLH